MKFTEEKNSTKRLRTWQIGNVNKLFTIPEIYLTIEENENYKPIITLLIGNKKMASNTIDNLGYISVDIIKEVIKEFKKVLYEYNIKSKKTKKGKMIK